MHKRKSRKKEAPDTLEMPGLVPTAPSQNTLDKDCTGRTYGNYPVNVRVNQNLSERDQLLFQQELLELQDEPWFHQLPRDVSLEILNNQLPGNFIVRQSESAAGCFALSVRTPPANQPKVAHYLILRTTKGGFMIKVINIQFTNQLFSNFSYILGIFQRVFITKKSHHSSFSYERTPSSSTFNANNSQTTRIPSTRQLRTTHT